MVNPKKMDLKSQILGNADLLRQMFQKINKTFMDKQFMKKQENVLLFNNACKKFKEAYGKMAFPGGLAKGFELLKKGDHDTVSVAIQFLEANPLFHRSGFIKEKVARLLRQVVLTPQQKKQIQEFLIRSLANNLRREFLEYCRLAHAFNDQKFQEKIEGIALEASDETEKRQAKRMLAVLRS